MPNGIGCCGENCLECPAYGSGCAGCKAAQGKGARLSVLNMELCPLYACCQDKGLSSCGECAELPCKKFYALGWPGLDEAALRAAINARVSLLRALHYS